MSCNMRSLASIDIAASFLAAAGAAVTLTRIGQTSFACSLFPIVHVGSVASAVAWLRRRGPVISEADACACGYS